MTTAPLTAGGGATTAETATLQVSGAHVHYELRGSGPLAVLVGAPMDAAAFAPLADLLAADYTVLTTDPRGIHRSSVADPDAASTPELRADDLARLITHVDTGPSCGCRLKRRSSHRPSPCAGPPRPGPHDNRPRAASGGAPR